MVLICLCGSSFSLSFFSMGFMHLYLAAYNLTTTDVVRNRGFNNNNYK